MEELKQECASYGPCTSCRAPRAFFHPSMHVRQKQARICFNHTSDLYYPVCLYIFQCTIDKLEPQNENKNIFQQRTSVETATNKFGLAITNQTAV